MGVARVDVFGTLPDGAPVHRFWLENAAGMRATVLALGGIVASLETPSPGAGRTDVVLGFDSVEAYLADTAFVGALIGRYANRIARGRFTLDGVTYRLPINDPPNHLHGGPRGFNRALWNAASGTGDPSLRLRHISPAGEDGYPGTLEVSVDYTLTDANELVIAYAAATDAATPVNCTYHGYFNLAGEGRGDVLGHELELHASRFTPVDATQIPTGDVRSVAGTPFDFSRPTPIGARIRAADPQLAIAGGYDENFLIDRPPGRAPALAARLRDPESGRWMEIETSQPAVQLYSGQRLDTVGKHGHRYGPHAGLALETQHVPDSPNHPEFPSTILRPGERYASRTVYRFGHGGG